MITEGQILRFAEACEKFAQLKPKEQFGMRSTLTEDEKVFLDTLMQDVWLHTILDHISASTFEAADSCDGEGRDCLSQQAATIVAAALFCKTWGTP